MGHRIRNLLLKFPTFPHVLALHSQLDILNSTLQAFRMSQRLRMRRSLGSYTTPTRVQGSRIDHPHTIHRQRSETVLPKRREPEPVGSAEASDTPPGEVPTAEYKLLEAHATELANHLRQRQAGLDHREAGLNARIAEFEKEVRSARIWMDQRTAETNEQQQAMASQSKELEQTSMQLASVNEALEMEMAEKHAELARQQAQLDQQKLVLRNRQEELKLKTNELEQAEIDWAANAAAEREAIDRTVEELSRVRGMLERQMTDVERQRGVNRRHQQELQHREQEIAERQQRQETEREKGLVERESQAARQAEELAERETRVSHLYEETVKLFQTTSEDRLLVEQLWTTLTQRHDERQLQQQMDDLRNKLTHVFASVRSRVEMQKGEVRSLLDQLEEHRDLIDRKRIELGRWLDEKYEAISKRERSIAEREVQVHALQTAMQAKGDGWDRERLDYQRQIRDLIRTKVEQLRVA